MDNNSSNTEVDLTKLPKQPMVYPVARYWCSKCGTEINKNNKYCHVCNLAISWEDISDN